MTGIYCIENTLNHNKYIGLSTQIEIRWQNHKRLLKRGKHENAHLQNAYNKYGDVFIFYVIEECEQEELNEREKYWIKFYDTKNHGYNESEGGGGIFNPTDDVRRKISEGLKGEKNGMYGMHLCGEQNAWFGKHHTEETKKKISEMRKNKYTGKDSPYAKRVQASTGEIFDTMKEAAQWAGVKDISSIGKACKGVSKTGGKHPITGERISWKYIDGK